MHCLQSLTGPLRLSTIFITTFVDTVRYFDVEFDLVVDYIENGTLPSLDGVEEARHHLEVCSSYWTHTAGFRIVFY
jgi:hypothetical protein